MRKSGSTWAEVVAHLKDVHGLETNISAVREFVLRQKRRALPADLQPDHPNVAKRPAADELPATESPAKTATPSGETASQRIRRERAERQRAEDQKGNFNFGSVYKTTQEE